MGKEIQKVNAERKRQRYSKEFSSLRSSCCKPDKSLEHSLRWNWAYNATCSTNRPRH